MLQPQENINLVGLCWTLWSYRLPQARGCDPNMEHSSAERQAIARICRAPSLFACMLVHLNEAANGAGCRHPHFFGLVSCVVQKCKAFLGMQGICFPLV